jgi:putative transposase
MSYTNDLADIEWELIRQHFKPRNRRGSACRHPRKRIVDALRVSVDAANHHDGVAAGLVLARTAEKHPGIKAFSGGAGYREAVTFVDNVFRLVLHISTKSKDHWVVLPKRRVVERTFA